MKYETADSLLQIVNLPRADILTELGKQRDYATGTDNRFDALRATRLMDAVRGGAPEVIFGGVSYRVDDAGTAPLPTAADAR